MSRIDAVVDVHSSIVQELLTKLSYALTSLRFRTRAEILVPSLVMSTKRFLLANKNCPFKQDEA